MQHLSIATIFSGLLACEQTAFVGLAVVVVVVVVGVVEPLALSG